MRARLLVDDLPLAFTDLGEGLPVLFQHGLGGDEAQVSGLFPDPAPGIRRLTLECRGHGGSPHDPAGRYAIRRFAEDCLRLADARRVSRFVAGGISLGAAIALHLACFHADRVSALILARPAWLFDPAPEGMRPYGEVARLLGTMGPVRGRAQFAEGATGRRLAEEAPANLASLLGFFAYPAPAQMARLLARIAADGPGVSEAAAARLALPALVIGHGEDHVHPLAYAARFAAILPQARLVEIPSKASDPAGHATAFRASLQDFLAGLAA